MPEELEQFSGDVQEDYLLLFDPSQHDRARSLFAGEEGDDSARKQLEALVREVQGLGVEPALLSDLLMHYSEMLRGSDCGRFCNAVQDLVSASEEHSEMNTPRLIQTLTRHCNIQSLEELEAARRMVERGIYPGPAMISRFLSLDEEDRREGFIDVLDSTMATVRKREEFDEKDEVALELYYTYLNVDMPFDTFVEVMNAVPANKIGFVPPQFKPFRISARGVEAMTQDTDPEVISGIQDHLLARSQLQNAKESVAQIPHLPGKTLSPQLKTELMILGSLTIADAVDRKREVDPNVFEQPFTSSNVLGTLEPIIGLPPSYEKFVWVHQGRKALVEFCRETEEQLKKAGKFTAAQQASMRANKYKAEQLRAKCAQAMVSDLPKVMEELSASSEGATAHLNSLMEILLDVDLLKSRTQEEDVLHKQLSQAVCLASYEQIPNLPSETVQELLRDKSYCLQRAGIAGQVGAPEELWNTLEQLALQQSPAMAEEVRTGRPELILENARELYHERVPEVLAGVVRSEDRCGNLAGEVRDAVRCFGEMQAREILQSVRKAVTGARGFIEKKGQSETLKAKFAAFERSVLKKTAEVEKYYDNPPEHIGRYYAPENTKFLAGSCRHHSSKNRTIAKMQEDESLNGAEQGMLASLRERLQQFTASLEVIHDVMIANERTWESKVQWEEGLPGITGRVDQLSGRLQEDVLARFPEYVDYMAQRTQLTDAYQQKKQKCKDNLYEDYCRQVEASGDDFDNGEFHEKLRGAIREIDREYSQQVKALRKEFEQNNPAAARAIREYEKCYAEVGKLRERLVPIGPYQAQHLDPVLIELNKISYRDLEEGEFELVPSKTKGDAVKAWVSNDCGTDTECAQQVMNGNFVNFRVYQRNNGDRTWCGNVYVLDAQYGQEPELLFDAIQVSRKTAVNARMFVQGVVDGFSDMGLKYDYQHIISNVIHSTAEGWLVSNRPQLREAYIKLFGGGLTIEDDGDQKVDIKDHPASDTFQSLTEGDGKFQVLWEHPDVQPVASVDDVDRFIRPIVGDQIADRVKRRAETDEFAYRVRFQSKRGVETMEALAQEPERLALYLDLAEQNFEDRTVLATLEHGENFLLMEQYHKHDPALAPVALRALAHSEEEDSGKLSETLDFLKERTDCTEYVTQLFGRSMVLSPSRIEETHPLYESFSKAGLGGDCITALALQYVSPDDMRRVADLADEEILQAEDEELGRAVLENMNRLKGIDVRAAVVSLKKLRQLCAGKSLPPSSLTPTQAFEAIRGRHLQNEKELTALVDAVSSGEDDVQQTFNLAYAGLALSDGLIPSVPPNRILKVLWNAKMHTEEGPKAEGKPNPITTQDVYSRIRNNRGNVDECETLIANITGSTTPEERSSLTRSMFVSRESLTPSMLLSSAPYGEMYDWHFFLSQIEDQDIEDKETLETLRAKFMERKFEARGLSQIPEIQRVARTGIGYFFVKEEYAGPISTMLSSICIQKRTQKGAGRQVEEHGKTEETGDEEREYGYDGIRDFIHDQVRIYSLPYHS